MNNILTLSIFITGLSGLVAQALLLRELLVSFFGNELTLGIILANWLVSEALGVFIIGRAVDRIKNKINLFIALQVIFSLSLFFAVYLARTFKGLLGAGPAEGIGLAAIFYSSLIVVLPAAFCHGGLFSAGCKILQSAAGPARAIGRVYAWETAGALFGGIVLTFVLIPILNSFQIVFLIAVINLVICLFIAADTGVIARRLLRPFGARNDERKGASNDERKGASNDESGVIARSPDETSGRRSNPIREIASPPLKYLIAGLLFFAILLAAGNGIGFLQDTSIARQWGKQRLLDYRNSVYANIAVTEESGQYTFFYNGLPVITTPFPDKQFIEEFGNLPLLFSPGPKEVLLIGGGAGGLINEVFKHPVKRLDYMELDPLLIEMLKNYPTSLTDSEFSDARLKIKNTDARFFLGKTTNKYDLILIGQPAPSDLSSNRNFSREFFSLAKKKLKEGGILAFRLPGSAAYLSRELAGLNACILNGLKDSYGYVRVIPGDYNIILASDGEGILTAGPAKLLERLSERNITDTLLMPDYLAYRLDQQKAKEFFQSLEGATKRINSDLRPFALFEALSIWNKQFSSKIAGFYDSMQGLDLKKIFLLISALTVILFVILRKMASVRQCHCEARSAEAISLGKQRLLRSLTLARNDRDSYWTATKFTAAYCIFTTGFFGMLASLLLILAFQVFYGYLYRSIGLLIGLFMAGAASGSIFMSARLEKIRRDFNLFALLETLIISFCLVLGLTIAGFGRCDKYAVVIFLALFYISGFLLGLEFPLAAKIYLKGSGRAGEASGALYGADLIGGWLAGIAGGIIFLPVLGFFNTCLVMALFKLSSLLLFLSAKNNLFSQ
ncbi:MAG: hypothetical protein V1925_01695 [Candidatus Omnitrophota bacterium]